MEDAKKERTKKARVVTRRVNELLNTIRIAASPDDVKEKANSLKTTIEELGTRHDEVMLLVEDDNAESLETEEKWYDDYYVRANQAIKEAGEYVKNNVPNIDHVNQTPPQVKLKKLEVPTFNGDYRNYFKWKELFEKYVKHLDEENKYYYLLNHTKGEANKLVTNKQSYHDAMESLDREFGNVNYIMKMLIDDIRSLYIVRKGDHKAFENLSREVNGFKDRLILMGKGEEAENSYILQEIESKLNNEDKQKWLEYLGDKVDDRKVDDICKWLENQSHIRRLTANQNPPIAWNRKSVTSSATKFESSSVCPLCKVAEHNISYCDNFLKSSNEERWEQVKQLYLCFICLSQGHRSFDCMAKKCEACHRPHHNLLHRWEGTYGKGENVPPGTINGNPTSYQTNTHKDNSMNLPLRTFLPIVRSRLKGNNNSVMATTLLDTGSEVNIVSKRMAKYLGLKGISITMVTVGVGGVSTQQITEKVELVIEDIMGKEISIEAIVLKKTCGNALSIPHEIVKDITNELQINPQCLYTKGGEIDLLLGMGVPQLHTQLRVHGDLNGLSIVETRFGPCLVGQAPPGFKGNYDTSAFNVQSLNMGEEIDLWRFVEAETAGVKKECACQLKSDEELKYEKVMESAWSTNENGHFQVKLPWKIDPRTIPNNKIQALHRDDNLNRQLAKKPEVARLFSEQIQEMIEQGVLKLVDENYPKRYLPLLAVVDMERDTTKVRVCLDAKTRFKKLCLNDVLLKGKLEMPDMLQILTVFRSGKFALLGDIKKMFWQIRLHEEDQQYGVIWKGNSYVFTRVCFGDKTSPNIAEESMVKIAYNGRETHPEASRTLINHRYVDDIVVSSDSETKITQKRNEIDELLGQFGFQIKRWYSNSKRLGDSNGRRGVLGCKWDIDNDTLSPNTPSGKLDKFTKRMVLSKIAEFWDPLGICVGVIISARLIFQSIVRLKLEWDEPCSDNTIRQRWDKCLAEISKCKDVIIGRRLCPPTTIENGKMVEFNCSLVGFSDGSNVANGCVIYLRWYNVDETHVQVKFVAAKGKLAPIKGITTPRNELCGSLLLARLASSTLEAFKKTDLTISDTALYTDSTTVLAWVKSDATRYKPFVKNKVIEVQDLLPCNVWRYVPSKENKAADLISRGCRYEELEVVIKGPAFLKLPKLEWPKPPNNENRTPEVELQNEEVKINVTSINQPIVKISAYSSWKKLLRVTAYARRFIELTKQEEERKQTDKIETPNHAEVAIAEEYWVKYAQKDMVLDDSVTKKLVPFEDKKGIQRVYGRIKMSHLFDYDRIHPIILPHSSEISKLILVNIHNELFHPGHLRVLAESRKKYWIINARKIAKSIGYNCIICRRWRRKPCNQLMSSLPESRLALGSSPFEYCCIDYFGPVLIKYGRRARSKAYGVIFTCLTTRAISIEMATDISTDRFLLALRRFISNFGQPKHIISDNGSNFIGAAGEIKELIYRWKEENEDSEKLRNWCAKYAIKWTFSTPLAPHHNGIVESMVKSVKSSLHKIVKERVLSEEEYRTVFAEIAACVNSRPLWPPSDGDVEQQPITCQDLLRPSTLSYDPLPLNVVYNPKKRYQYIQQIVSEWWKLWMLHFVPNLQSRSKWYKPRENVEEGDIVLLIDKNEKRSQWNMGRILRTYPGKDQKVRSVQVRTQKKGVYDRPITKLGLLLSKKEFDDVKNKDGSSQEGGI